MKKGRRMLALLLAVVTIATSTLFFTMSAYGAESDGTVVASVLDDMKEQNGEGTEEPGNVSDSTNLKEGTEGSAAGEQSTVQENSLMQNQLEDSAVGFESEIEKLVKAKESGTWEIEDVAEKSLPEVGITKGNTSNDVEPVLSGGATTGTITAITAGTPGIQQFQYTADGEVTFMFMTGGMEVKGVSYEASNGILTVNDGTTDYNVIMYSEANPYIASARTVFAYNYSVTYNLDGTSVTAESGNINKADGSVTHTAPLMYTRSGVEYELVGGANNQTQVISYDKLTSNYVFNYQVYNPQDRTLSISLNDERGNSIETITETVKYKGGDVTVEIPQTLEKDGRKYQLRDTISSVTVNYFSTNFVYNYTYRELEAPNIDPYSVKLLFLEEGTDKPLGEDYFTVSAEDIANGATVTYSPSKERSLLEGDTRVYYTLVSDEVISHDAVNGYKTLSYNVYYKKQAEDAPYTWTYKPKVRIDTRRRNQVIRRVVRSGSTRTGDDAPIALIILLLILSGGGAGFLVYRIKKNKKS